MIQRRNGTINSNRLPENLLDAPFKIDQRYFWDIIGFIALYLEKINYYNIQNKREGDWKILVEGDPIIFMVMIINHPVKDLETLMEFYGNNSLQEPDLDEKVALLVNWYDKVNGWYQTLLALGEKRLAYKIKNVVVDILLPKKNNILLLQRQQASKKNEEKLVIGVKSMPKPSLDEEMEPRQILSTYHRIVIHIKEFVKEYLQKNIYAKNDHKANNAMYIAFTLLFKKAQNHINGLSKRHLDFYYKDVLKQELDKGSPTRAVINVNLLPTVASSFLPKGTAVSAGKIFGSKTDVLFELTKPLVAYNIGIGHLQTLLFNASNYIAIGTNNPTISYVTKNDLIIDGKTSGAKEDWFVFGANKQSAQNTNIPENQSAEMGFIIGSPVLYLSEGVREIEIVIEFEESTSTTFWRLLNEIKTSKAISLTAVFYKVFSDAFTLSYTTVKGWEVFKNYTITFKENEYFTINVVLEKGNAALTTSAKIKESLSWPSIKLQLNEYAPVYAYSFFKGVAVDTIQINVKVSGIKDVVLYNNVGKMAAGKAFDLFGPTPDNNSYLLIGKNEIFRKNTTGLAISLDWENIPKAYGGFVTYYEGYPEPFSNNSFKVDFNALSNGNWLPANENEAPEFNLFTSEPCLTPEGYKSEKLANSTTISITNFDKIVVDANLYPNTPLEYTVTTQSGFVRLVLTSPQQGFGTKAYEEQYLKVATYNARAIVNKKATMPFPNRPYVPKLNGLSLSYKASDTLFFKPNPADGEKAGINTGQFIHLTPFGNETIIDGDQAIQKHTLLPNFQSEGYLFIGLDGVLQTTPVSLYFHFLHSSTAVNLPKNGLQWQYYFMDDWVTFQESDIILDGTNGFTKSGIVEMVLPKNNRNTNEELSNETYWIRISTKKNSIHYPKIKGVYVNAVEVVCTDNSADVMGKEVAANRIAKIVGRFPDVKKVNQAAASYGGISVEQPDQFYTRVSERLRHKDRALSIWDYERLVLANFDDVLVAKCTNFNNDFKPIPGIVKMIVLSKKWTNDERNYFDGAALDRIKTFLQKLASPFADITVINPQVEYLLVNCTVVFKAEDNGGYYLNKLNDDISHFLSPIANIDSGRGGIGGNVVPTMLVSYIEKRPYVSLVRALSIEHIVRKGLNNYTVGIYSGSNEIRTTTPEAILSPVVQHQIISSVAKSGNVSVSNLGIGTVEIGLDFVIQESAKSSKKLAIAENEALNTDQGLQDDAVLVFKDKA
ncbi:MAG: baseplate J/gp47 family protein [Bacteroidota bacterium]